VGFAFALSMRWIAFPFRSIDWLALLVWTSLGIASGTTFALLLARLERERTVDTLAPNRLVAWGTLAGAGVPIVFSALLLAVLPSDIHLARSAYGTFGLMGATGAATALLTISLARRGRERTDVAPPPT